MLRAPGNAVRRLEGLPDSLRELNLANNRIERLQNLPEDLLELDLSRNCIPVLQNLPPGLRSLHIRRQRVPLFGWRPENVPRYLQTLAADARNPLADRVRSGLWAAENLLHDRRETVLTLLACCPLVRSSAAQGSGAAIRTRE